MAIVPVAETDVRLQLIPLSHVNGRGISHYLTPKGSLQEGSPLREQGRSQYNYRTARVRMEGKRD
jgi:hypothetical protein